MRVRQTSSRRTGLEIAVIGMAGRFPGAPDLSRFWDNLVKEVESVRFFSPEELSDTGIPADQFNHPDYVKASGVLDDIESFDASFFGYKKQEARTLDPQVRLFLECSWEALEDAGYETLNYPGVIGIFAGASPNTFWRENVTRPDAGGPHIPHFNTPQYMELPARVSYRLDLDGPGGFVYCGGATSLAAIRLGCQSILTGDCDMVIAGGVTITVPSHQGYRYSEGGFFSFDGHSRVFAEGADGTVPGSGVGAVILKLLTNAVKDRDNIYAVIKSTALTTHGGHYRGDAAPDTAGPAQAIRRALETAEVSPETIGYIEANGMGTAMWDQAEIEAMTTAFKTEKKQFCAVGSLKSNIGHLDCAAGIAAFIKAVLAIKHKRIPPTLNCQQLNSRIDFARTPFYVNSELTEWIRRRHPLRAGVSAFDTGGTNAHIILEEAPKLRAPAQGASADPGQHIIMLSARTDTAIKAYANKLVAFFMKNPFIDMADAAYTLQLGRREFKHRLMLVCSDANEAVGALNSLQQPSQLHIGKVRTFFSQIADPPLIFMFTGPGNQYVDMGLDLYRDQKFFREQMDLCFAILRPILGYDLKVVLYPGEPAAGLYDNSTARDINHPEVILSSLFIIQYSLAKLLGHWGLNPHGMIGHGFGEYAAACFSGVISVEESLELLVTLGRLMEKMTDDPMLNPAHSALMDPILDEFRKKAGQVYFNKPQVPYISSPHGTWITPQQAADPEYWVNHLRETVCFADGIKELKKKPNAMFLEVGPGRDLSLVVQRQNDFGAHQKTICLMRGKDEEGPDTRFLLDKIGRLWLYGRFIDWPALHEGEKRNRISLPTYPFERQFLWPEFKPLPQSVAVEPEAVEPVEPGEKIEEAPETKAPEPPEPKETPETIEKQPKEEEPFPESEPAEELSETEPFAFDEEEEPEESEVAGEAEEETIGPAEPEELPEEEKEIVEEEEPGEEKEPAETEEPEPGAEEETPEKEEVSEKETAGEKETEEEEDVEVQEIEDQEIEDEEIEDEEIEEKEIEEKDEEKEETGEELEPPGPSELPEEIEPPEPIDVPEPIEETDFAGPFDLDEPEPLTVLPVEEREYYPLTPVQSFWYNISSRDDEAAGKKDYIEKDYITRAVELHGSFDGDRLQSVFHQIIERHEIFRTSFFTIDRKAYQRVHSSVEMPMQYLGPGFGEDSESIAEDSQEIQSPRELQEIIDGFAGAFDLSAPPLMRVGCLPLDYEKSRFLVLVTLHSLVSDEITWERLVHEFAALYSGEELPGLQVQYKDYAVWLDNKRESKDYTTASTYWHGRFPEVIPGLNLPGDFIPEEQSDAETGTVDVKADILIPADTIDRLTGAENGENAVVKPDRVIAALYGALIARLTGTEEVITGIPVSGRPFPELESMTGHMTNLLPLRLHPTNIKTFRDFILEVSGEISAALEHQEYRLEDADHIIAPDTVFHYQYPPYFLTDVDIPELEVRPYDLAHSRETEALRLECREIGDGVICTFITDSHRFSPQTAARWSRCFLTLAESAAGFPYRGLGEMEILPENERKTLISTFNNTKEKFPQDKTPWMLFADQAEKAPDNVALAGSVPGGNNGEVTVTYRRLLHSASAMAELLMINGAGPGAIVGLLMSQSVHWLSVVTGIMKTGSGFLPIDPMLPPERLAVILDDCCPHLLVTLDAPATEAVGICPVLHLEDRDITAAGEGEMYGNGEDQKDQKDKGDKDHSVDLTSPAVVLYTEQPDGHPLGIITRQEGLINLCSWHNRQFKVTPGDRAAVYSEPGHESAVWEFLPYLTAGASVYLPNSVVKHDTKDLNLYFHARDISIAFLPYGICETFLKEENRSLRLLLTTGRRLKADVPADYPLVNCYGLPEYTMVTCSFTVTRPDENIPVGTPIDNTRIYVLDPWKRLLPEGIPGRLYISGPGLAAGYVNNQELTGERFLSPGEFKSKELPSETLFRTGHQVRWLPGGVMQFIGPLPTTETDE